MLARRLTRVPHVNMVNLILGRPAVPELLQEDCRADRIAAAAVRLIGDEAARDQQAALAAVAACAATSDRQANGLRPGFSSCWRIDQTRGGQHDHRY